MKTTRRKLLGLLGLGAAAAALGASKPAEAAPYGYMAIPGPIPDDPWDMRPIEYTIRPATRVEAYGDDFGHKTNHAEQWSNVFLRADEIAVIVPVPETARG